MNAKKVVGFLFMAPAFTQRNLTSVGLVVLFFVVYVLMGGKITTQLPQVSKEGVFGSGGIDGFMKPAKKAATASTPEGEAAKAATAGVDKESAKDVLGINQSEEREARRRASLGTTFFSEEERKKLEAQPIDKEGLVKGVEIKRNKIDWSKRREAKENKSRDMLSDIEERLSVGGNKK
jgi:hypothetical protein